MSMSLTAYLKRRAFTNPKLTQTLLPNSSLWIRRRHRDQDVERTAGEETCSETLGSAGAGMSRRLIR